MKIEKRKKLRKRLILKKLTKYLYLGELLYPSILACLLAVILLSALMLSRAIQLETPLVYLVLALTLPSILSIIFHLVYDLYIIFRSKSFIPLDVNKLMDYRPLVTVMIPVYNEPAELVRGTLKSLKGLDYPHLEILVTDESEPDFAEEIEGVCTQEGVVFVHKEKDDVGFNAGALRFGVENANGEIIGIVDSDYRVNPDWLNRVIPYFGYEQVKVVNCPQSYSNVDHPVARVVASFREQGKLKDIARYVDGSLTSSATMILIHKSTFKKYFTGDYITEDFAFSVRMLLDGKLTFYFPDSLGQGQGPTNITHYARQQMRWLDNFKIFKDYFSQIMTLPKIKVIHLFYHCTQFLYVVPVVNLFLLGLFTAFMDLELSALAVLIYAIIEVQKFIFIKSQSKNLRYGDFPMFIIIGLTIYPYILYEFLNIMVGGKQGFFRTPKEECVTAG